MTEMIQLLPLLFVFLLGIKILFDDHRKRIIENRFSILMALFAVLWIVLSHRAYFSPSVLVGFLQILFFLCIGVVLVEKKMIGGGDIKLALALSLFFLHQHSPFIFIGNIAVLGMIFFLTATGVALVRILLRRDKRDELGWIVATSFRQHKSEYREQLFYMAKSNFFIGLCLGILPYALGRIDILQRIDIGNILKVLIAWGIAYYLAPVLLRRYKKSFSAITIGLFILGSLQEGASGFTGRILEIFFYLIVMQGLMITISNVASLLLGINDESPIMSKDIVPDFHILNLGGTAYAWSKRYAVHVDPMIVLRQKIGNLPSSLKRLFGDNHYVTAEEERFLRDASASGDGFDTIMVNKPIAFSAIILAGFFFTIGSDLNLSGMIIAEILKMIRHLFDELLLLQGIGL